MKFFRHFIVAACALLIPPSLASADEPRRTISANGQAAIFVTPDNATITFGVETFDKELEKSQAANTAAGLSLVKALKEVGIKETDIATEVMRMSINYNHTSQNAAERFNILGYSASRSYTVKIVDPKHIEPAVTAALKNGANTLTRFEWQVADLRKHREAARTLAAKAAKGKAVALAKDLDAVVGKVQMISEGVYSSYNTYANDNVDRVVANEPGDEGAVPAGKVAIRAAVYATWLLE